MIAIGAGIAALACIGAGIGIGIATSKAAEAVARQPEAESKITKILLLGGALAEATAIYGFVIGILIIRSWHNYPKPETSQTSVKCLHL